MSANSDALTAAGRILLESLADAGDLNTAASVAGDEPPKALRFWTAQDIARSAFPAALRVPIIAAMNADAMGRVGDIDAMLCGGEASDVSLVALEAMLFPNGAPADDTDLDRACGVLETLSALFGDDHIFGLLAELGGLERQAAHPDPEL
jgi:hypothetical protein